MTLNPQIYLVTETIKHRSTELRNSYLNNVKSMAYENPARENLGCGNFAHAIAASDDKEKMRQKNTKAPNIAIVTAYNDMLSAHQPYRTYPEKIKSAINNAGGTAQVAGGVPAMCDGITQGQLGMELSLFSRDTIAKATAIALSHQMFDGAIMLGVCDKIVPGLLIGALQFGHLPTVFIPAGPMPSGISNSEKVSARKKHAAGLISSDKLLDAECSSYHSPGTCTFYGTANSNQILLEAMGLQYVGSSFVQPNTELREQLTQYSSEQILGATALGNKYLPLYEIVTAEALVNAIVALLASGGSTNHTIHLIAIARAAGYLINWDDFDIISKATPSLCKIYPNGEADINQFHLAGGTHKLFLELQELGLLHLDTKTCTGRRFGESFAHPILSNGELQWSTEPSENSGEGVLARAASPFHAEGGIQLLTGNIGRSVIKVSAVSNENKCVRAEAIVLSDPSELKKLYDTEQLNKDAVIVVPNQGPKANGMPELHQLMPILLNIQSAGHKVALITDGRMSGASGAVPAAIHMVPEAADNGMIGLIRTGDMITLDAIAGSLSIEVDSAVFKTREYDRSMNCRESVGRQLFQNDRKIVSNAEKGASTLFD